MWEEHNVGLFANALSIVDEYRGAAHTNTAITRETGLENAMEKKRASEA